MSSPHVWFVHGALDRATSFERVRRCLPELATTAYDRRGYGRARGLGVTDFAGHVADLLDRVGDGPAVVVGHSLGGDVALAAAVRRPQAIGALVVYEPPMPWQPWWPTDTAGGAATQAEGPEAAAEAFMRRMVGDDRWERLPARTKADRRAEGVALLADVQAIRTEAPFDLADVRVPVVVGVGGRSRDHQKEAAPKLAEALPDAELVVIEEASHGAHLSHPKEFAALVRRALARL